MIGPATMTPMNSASAPNPMMGAVPNSMPAAPSPTSTPAATIRRRVSADVSTAAWRSASIGSVRAARRAGIITEKKVINVPTIIPCITTFGDTVIPLPGRATPTALSTAIRTNARPNPATTPSAEPMTPITRPSRRNDRLICLGVAPIAARTASSRRRCATITLKVL